MEHITSVGRVGALAVALVIGAAGVGATAAMPCAASATPSIASSSGPSSIITTAHYFVEKKVKPPKKPKTPKKVK
jgi:hypothetical protein